MRISPSGSMRGPGRTRRSGFTLIELMVAILIGFAVVGALLAAYMASYRSTLHNDALSEVTEDATLALSAIRAQAAMAGYSHVTVNEAAQTMQKRGFPWLFACADSNFVGPSFGPITSSAACTGTSTSDTLEVAYEANDSSFAGGSSNAILNASGQPLDCLGNPFAQTTDGSGNLYYLNDSKFFVSNGKLYCQGPGNLDAGQPLVDNVDQMSVTFGWNDGKTVAKYDNTSAPVQAYIPAPHAAVSAAVWGQLVSVTVCVQVHSTSIAIEPDGTKVNPLARYIDCAGNPAVSPDGLLRRSFSTTIVFQNRVI